MIFDIDNIGVGWIDEYFDYWLYSLEVGSFIDVYIMDMMLDFEYIFQELNVNFVNYWLMFDYYESEVEVCQKYVVNVVI